MPEPIHRSPFTIHHSRLPRWLIPLGGLLALAGYFGPWVDHNVAGLAILGLDLGEYVKFLPDVRSGQISLWREGFYLPLVAVSLTFSLYTFRPELRYRWPVRALLLATAAVAALNLLPPAWTPQRMLTPEFHQQAIALVICLTAMAVSPLLALLPRWMAALLAATLCGLAAVVPVWQFGRVLPAIGVLYNHVLWPGWGVVTMVVGLVLVAVSAVLLLIPRPQPAAVEG